MRWNSRISILRVEACAIPNHQMNGVRIPLANLFQKGSAEIKISLVSIEKLASSASDLESRPNVLPIVTAKTAFVRPRPTTDPVLR